MVQQYRNLLFSAAIGNEHPELIENDKEQPHEIDDIEDGSDEWNNIDKLQRMLLEEEATTAAAITLPKGAMLIALLLSFTIRF